MIFHAALIGALDQFQHLFSRAGFPQEVSQEFPIPNGDSFDDFPGGYFS